MTTDNKSPAERLPSLRGEMGRKRCFLMPDNSPERMIAIDVGAGTQDILIYEPGLPYENLVKLVLPSQTQIVSRQIRDATADQMPVHLAGTIMGGGASSDAVKAHLAEGLVV